MKQFIRKIPTNYLIAIITMLITILFLVGGCSLFIFGYSEIPLGVLLGASLSSLIYLGLGLAERLRPRYTSILTIALIALRYFLVIGVTVLLAVLYYKLMIKIFNPFAFVGGYFISMLSLITVSLIRKK